MRRGPSRILHDRALLHSKLGCETGKDLVRTLCFSRSGDRVQSCSVCSGQGATVLVRFQRSCLGGHYFCGSHFLFAFRSPLLTTQKKIRSAAYPPTVKMAPTSFVKVSDSPNATLALGPLLGCTSEPTGAV